MRSTSSPTVPVRRVVAALALVAAPVLLGAARCYPPAPPEAAGTVRHVRDEPAANGGTRKVVTLEDAEGRTWTVRLPPDTRCVEGASYPTCTRP